MWLEYWGKTTDDYSAMRGPCGVGFHVPLKTEWQKLKTMMDSLSFTTWDDWRIKLHMPFSGKRAFNNAALSFQWVYWCYWTCISQSGSGSEACHLNISSSQVSANYITSRADGLSIRPFKDVPVIPTSSRTTIYEWGTWWDWTNWYTPWIFWDQTNWLISISSNWKTTDSSVWITIADKNLWATTVYSDWNTLSQSNCWNYFQRWNNYWFAWTWSITTSSTQVDASGYWPWNYYSGNTFIIWSQDWSSVRNDNIRWWVTWIKHSPVYIVDRYYWGKTIQDYSAMRGPCPEGYHIPLDSERNSVRIMLHNFWMSYTDIVADLHLPISGYRAQEYWSYYNGQVYYWTSKVFNNSYLWQAYRISTYTADDVITTQGEATWWSIRPFHDWYVAPTSSWTTIRSSWNGWIFWNQTDWLISITSNGVSGCTIADKNLWATTVYNNWNTLSEANCWKFYQRWNNYWFPFSWNVTTSSTKVTNANNYWPWNYYSSSTFVISTDSNTTWMNPVNPNLWWWVTWVQNRVAKVKEVYYNTTKIWPAYPAWVYWNQSLWLISASSNWTDWVTITDKNLWATVVYNQWDTMSESNCWKFYQRWNNYWFSFTWTPSRTSTKVNVSSYWPNNYYSSSTFVRVNWDWRWWTDASSTTALNLRWDITNTNEARRWPCPEWFHIPSHTEGMTLMDIPRTLQRLTWDAKRAVYKIPKCWFRDNYSSQVVDTWNDWAMWTTTQEATDFWWTMPSAWFWPAWWLNIRPFRNTAIIPTDEWVKLL